MEWSWKKTFTLLGIFIVIVVTPCVLLSNRMCDWYQEQADKDPKSEFWKWMAITSANTCYRTGRPEKSADYYRRYLERYPEDEEQRPFVKLRWGKSLEDSKRGTEAIAVYESYEADYPDRPDAAEARNGITRIRYVGADAQYTK